MPVRNTKKTAIVMAEVKEIGPLGTSSTGATAAERAGSHSADKPSTATTAASAKAAPRYCQTAITKGGKAKSTAAVTVSSVPWRKPKARTLLGNSPRMRMPRQDIVEAKNPIKAQTI